MLVCVIAKVVDEINHGQQNNAALIPRSRAVSMAIAIHTSGEVTDYQTHDAWNYRLTSNDDHF